MSVRSRANRFVADLIPAALMAATRLYAQNKPRYVRTLGHAQERHGTARRAPDLAADIFPAIRFYRETGVTN